jgi:hypothetical protein
MLVPAAVYVAFNAGGPGAHGWGIPMATDIAFALGVLALLGPRVPRGLTVFLAALAIVDDLGAVSVIAIFYTAKLNLGALFVALAIVRRPSSRARGQAAAVYLAAAPLLWYFMFQSACIPPSPACCWVSWCRWAGRRPDISDSPLETLEHGLKPWITWLVMPLFALANAGVAIRHDGGVAHPIAAGCRGPVRGQTLGIFGVSGWPCGRGRGASSRGRWAKLWAVAMIAGIGFTMSLFVASLSFHAGDGSEDWRSSACLGSLVWASRSGWPARSRRGPAIAGSASSSCSPPWRAGAARRAGSPPRVPPRCAAERDSLHAASSDRADTDVSLRTNPNSALGAIARVDFGRPPRARVVGSAPTCDLGLDDPSVRAQHVRVTVAGDSFHVQALDPGATFTAFSAGGRDTTGATLPPSWIGVGRYRVRLSHQNAPALVACDPDLPAKAAYPARPGGRSISRSASSPRSSPIRRRTRCGSNRRAARRGRRSGSAGSASSWAARNRNWRPCDCSSPA